MQGGFGGSPPKIDSHFNAQCGFGGSPPKKIKMRAQYEQ